MKKDGVNVTNIKYKIMVILNKYFDDLTNQLILEEYSMVEKPLFSSIYYEKDKIDILEGDIVECGVYKGGMSLFLTKLFPNKKIWLVDSYDEGFQDINTAPYKTDKLDDPHKKGYPIKNGELGIPMEQVKEFFNNFGEGSNPNINYIKGFVKDVLDPKVCSIDKISLLRIDVDAYSATREVLELLYHKVVSGGMIIFDDANIDSARLAIEEFFQKENIILNTIPPTHPGQLKLGLNSAGCYFFKK
jgi:hypothetical protein